MPEQIKNFTLVVEFNSAEDFLLALLPTSKHFESLKSMELSNYFRGHADASWQLLPTALRPSGSGFMTQKDNNRAQIKVELDLLKMFFDISDSAGLTLPEDSQRLRKQIDKLSREASSLPESLWEEYVWPPEELLSLIALAQHSRLPTRLLDWTYSPLIACYFAAKGAKELGKVKSNGELAVWMFDVNLRIVVEELMKIKGKLPLYSTITAPYASNPNIYAQRGFFTLINLGKIDPNGVVDRRPFDMHISEYLKLEGHNEESPLLYCFKLPWEYASDLLILLEKMGVNASTVYPGFDGVVSTVRDRIEFNHPL